jgi:phosphoribosylformylglycinamidine (FGAM) synthase-like enzyme
LAASLAAKCSGVNASEGSLSPQDWAVEKAAMKWLDWARGEGLLSSVRSVEQGGVAFTALKMMLGAGDKLRVSKGASCLESLEDLYVEQRASYLIEFVPGKETSEAKAKAANLNLVLKKSFAHSDNKGSILMPFGHISLAELYEVWHPQGRSLI